MLSKNQEMAYSLVALSRAKKRNRKLEWIEPAVIAMWADELYKYHLESDVREVVRARLRELEKFGYVEGKVLEREIYHPYAKGVTRTYKVRAFKLTEKGIKKLKEWAGK